VDVKIDPDQNAPASDRLIGVGGTLAQVADSAQTTDYDSRFPQE
jgi:hypothetical protein